MRRRSQTGEVQIFRPALVLRVAIAVAAGAWVLVLVALRSLGGVPATTFWPVVGFVAFFGAAYLYYSSQWIAVDDLGVTQRGIGTKKRASFDEIQKVRVLPGLPVTVYSVVTRHGLVLFTSFVKGHRQLFELIRERARLDRL